MKYTALFTLGLSTVLSGYAIAQAVSPSASSLALLPSEIQAPADQQLLLTVRAEGDQIYTCQAKADVPNQFEWTLKAPEALLYDERGQEVGHHYGGPSWEMKDGSKIVGQLQSKVDAPEASAIPWLLLQVKSHEGDGVLSQVNWIQRVNTVGGKAPQTGCNLMHQNQEIRVNYAADYYFFGQE
ncbi:DUF3455 domain-containing protein [Leptolyngbya sp. NK1-12]|uniref:DUF3455 domain-containing protein n=1 Tax=Leptolyngbya sp. NK1-12 TaxID=2547451 RepID=A0AA96W9G1_9CYAN|nr:DUF3455 domain-containing protein [Leptolyngbya sp. NK1-12]WNZ22192.1 DUF3455 domain-containing protein [Leptolyngbya sp. NK1-12]